MLARSRSPLRCARTRSSSTSISSRTSSLRRVSPHPCPTARSPGASSRRRRSAPVVTCRVRAQLWMTTDAPRPLARLVASLGGRRDDAVALLCHVPSQWLTACSARVHRRQGNVRGRRGEQHAHIPKREGRCVLDYCSAGELRLPTARTTHPWSPGLATPCVLTSVTSLGRSCAICGRRAATARIWVCTCERRDVPRHSGDRGPPRCMLRS